MVSVTTTPVTIPSLLVRLEVPGTSPKVVEGTRVTMTLVCPLPSSIVVVPGTEPVSTTSGFTGVGVKVTTTPVTIPSLLVRLEVPGTSPVAVEGTRVTMTLVCPLPSSTVDVPATGPVSTTSGFAGVTVTTTPVITPRSSGTLRVPGVSPVTVEGTTVRT
ncbi:hypothetical protein B0I75DRAFT_2109 [Yarrowia lipolytica]|nr:hypothetical protein B0I75DRAFT_2109 [Yarrowia lipolytica]